MTTRYNALIVVLQHDLREDDAAPLIAAIQLLQGVLSVEPVSTAPDSMVAEARVRERYRQRLVALLDEIDQREHR